MCILGECNFRSSPGKSLSEDSHLPWLPTFRAKDVPLLILIGWIGQAGKLLNLSPPIRPKFRRELRHPLRHKLEFGVAWIQDDPAKIMTYADRV
jgi:hypothetical protein